MSRPLASGRMAIGGALMLAPILFTAALDCAAMLGSAAAGILLAYGFLAYPYTFDLKRRLLADTVMLGVLYMMRIVAGNVVTAIAFSPGSFPSPY